MKMIETNFLKQLLLGLFLFAIAAACNDEAGLPNEELEFTSVAIPDDLKGDNSNGTEIDEVEVEITTNDGRKVRGTVRVTMPIGDDERLVSFEVTSNILLAADVDSNFWIDSVASINGRVEGIGSCLKACSHEDVKRPGACRTGCWAELALKVVAVIILL